MLLIKINSKCFTRRNEWSWVRSVPNFGYFGLHLAWYFPHLTCEKKQAKMDKLIACVAKTCWTMTCKVERVWTVLSGLARIFRLMLWDEMNKSFTRANLFGKKFYIYGRTTDIKQGSRHFYIEVMEGCAELVCQVTPNFFMPICSGQFKNHLSKFWTKTFGPIFFLNCKLVEIPIRANV
jgi:hypothetical protein